MKRIKLFCSLALAVVLVAGCAALSRTPAEQAAEDARVERLVKQRLKARKYRIEVDFMQPMRGASRVLTSPYSVTVNEKHLVSYLPYMGVAYNVPYGGGKGLNFESEIEEYTEQKRGDRRIIEFVTDNDEDYLLYHIEVFDNGRADIHVQSRNREAIDFRGTLLPDFDPDEPDN